jgi:hypothetical protein
MNSAAKYTEAQGRLRELMELCIRFSRLWFAHEGGISCLASRSRRAESTAIGRAGAANRLGAVSSHDKVGDEDE